MKIIKLNLKKRAYDIVVGTQALKLLGKYVTKLKLGKDAYVITNLNIKNRHGEILHQALIRAGLEAKFKLLPDTEKSKSIQMASLIIQDILSFDKKKNVFIIAFGGGVIGDLAGFVASIYKRGIPYIQVPTTLLAQVDSSIGGKTAVDSIAAKNIIGTFYQPRMVFSDISLLKTLNLRQLRSGMAEVIKYGIIKDPHLLRYLENRHADILLSRPSALEFIVTRCSAIKASIVEKDETEKKGIRTILNFGHTIGHALEAAGSYKAYNHGEAVAIGMVAAGYISVELGLIDNRILQRIENLLKAVGLPTRIKSLSVDKILKAHYHDKKFIGSRNRFVLITGIGKTKICQNIPLSLIKRALRRTLQ